MKKQSTYARKRARMSEWQRVRHKYVHPVSVAYGEQHIEHIVDEIQQLRTGAMLHAFTGGNAAELTEQAGRLAYVVAFAAGAQGLGRTPDARILEGAASAMGDLSEHPADIERVRASICNGLDAADRLLPQLAPLAMAAGALHLDEILQVRGLMVSDVRRALLGGLAA